MAVERLTPAERAAFFAHLRRVIPFEDAELGALDAALKPRQLAAGQLFLRAGERAVDCGLVLSGVARGPRRRVSRR